MKKPNKTRLIIGEKRDGWALRVDPLMCTIVEAETAVPVMRALADKRHGPTLVQAQLHARAACYVPDFVRILRKMQADMSMLKTSQDTLAQEIAEQQEKTCAELLSVLAHDP